MALTESFKNSCVYTVAWWRRARSQVISLQPYRRSFYPAWIPAWLHIYAVGGGHVDVFPLLLGQCIVTFIIIWRVGDEFISRSAGQVSADSCTCVFQLALPQKSKACNCATAHSLCHCSPNKLCLICYDRNALCCSNQALDEGGAAAPLKSEFIYLYARVVDAHLKQGQSLCQRM